MSQVLSSGWNKLPGNQRNLDAFFEFQERGTSAGTLGVQLHLKWEVIQTNVTGSSVAEITQFCKTFVVMLCGHYQNSCNEHNSEKTNFWEFFFIYAMSHFFIHK